MSKLLRLLTVVAVIAAVAAGRLAWYGHRSFTAPGPLAEPTDVVIPKGSGLDAVARRLEEAGVIDGRWVFMVGAKLRRANLKAGEFSFPAHVSPEEAMRLLAEGRTVVHKLTIAEGLTTRAVLEMVRQADFLSGDITLKPAEGTLLPETWHLSRDDARDEVVARMEKAMRQALESLWAARDRDLPLKSPAEAVVLASMVERETPLAAERPRVAAVFYNRLRLGMRLQSDPTVIYGLSDGWGVLDRPLVHDDLGARHRWNTYVIDGLPPTPIANPGRASLEAVMHPAHSSELYFVADGNGGHVFARTLDEHNANVTKWRALQKKRGAE
ncbi:MAG: endolytic transglycosylase MltG [Actinomycetota bacterium]